MTEELALLLPHSHPPTSGSVLYWLLIQFAEMDASVVADLTCLPEGVRVP